MLFAKAFLYGRVIAVCGYGCLQRLSTPGILFIARGTSGIIMPTLGERPVVAE
jgi:hypothetical protein